MGSEVQDAFFLISVRGSSNLTSVKMVASNRQATPTSPVTILEPEDQEIDQCYVVQERRAADLYAPKY